jgi:pentatricopeptide repeat protein
MDDMDAMLDKLIPEENMKEFKDDFAKLDAKYAELMERPDFANMSTEEIAKELQASLPEELAAGLPENFDWAEDNDIDATLGIDSTASKQPGIEDFNQEIAECLSSGNLQKMVKTYELMQSAGYTPTVLTFGLLIKGFAQHNKLIMMEKVLEHMQQYNVEPTVRIFNRVLRAYGRADRKDDFSKWHKQMQDAGVEPNEVTEKLVSRFGS